MAEIVLIGAGIMSATIGTLIKELEPSWNITIYERLHDAGEESSNEWNNAGTGHSALCELNYTTIKPDGSIDIKKAIKVNEEFQLSRQFWAHLVRSGQITNPEDFITTVPHMSFVEGEKDVTFLRKRFEALSKNPLFTGMAYSEDAEQLSKWIPLMMESRSAGETIAATRVETGTDVNFGALTRMLISNLVKKGVKVYYKHQVDDLARAEDGSWNIRVRDLTTNSEQVHNASFAFLGAGGGSLHLLQKSGIPEGKSIGGFPVSGLFMVCQNQEIVKKHHAKVYGQAPVGAPPMSVPHLDTRVINGKQSLLFGPFAGFTPKFLKEGSMLDLIKSVKPHNLTTMLAAGAKNMGLTWYLIKQLLLSKEQRVEELRKFIPDAKSEDWTLITAGQRVQIIKDTAAGKGTLQFGTEVICAADGSISALLGASPGASTAVSVMLEVLNKCFSQQLTAWEVKIRAMIPSYGVSLNENQELFAQLLEETSKMLELK